MNRDVMMNYSPFHCLYSLAAIKRRIPDGPTKNNLGAAAINHAPVSTISNCLSIPLCRICSAIRVHRFLSEIALVWHNTRERACERKQRVTEADDVSRHVISVQFG